MRNAEISALQDKDTGRIGIVQNAKKGDLPTVSWIPDEMVQIAAAHITARRIEEAA